MFAIGDALLGSAAGIKSPSVQELCLRRLQASHVTASAVISACAKVAQWAGALQLLPKQVGRELESTGENVRFFFWWGSNPGSRFYMIFMYNIYMYIYIWFLTWYFLCGSISYVFWGSMLNLDEVLGVIVFLGPITTDYISNL